MKNFSSDLMALLQRNRLVWPTVNFEEIYRPNLFKIGPAANGQMLYATDGQLPVTYGGNTYQPVSFGNWSRGAISSKLGLGAGTMKLAVTSGPQNPIYFPGTQNSALLIDGIKKGLLNAAAVTVYTAYMPVWGQVTGPSGGSLIEIKFVGNVTNLDRIGETSAEFTCSDPRYLLNLDTPQRLISPTCWWVLYSAGCTLNKSSFQASGSITGFPNPNGGQSFFAAHINPLSAAGTFTQGVLTWTSGPNSGLSAHVKQWATGSPDQWVLDIPTLFPMAVGHTFTVVQGCDHTFASCLDLQGSTNAMLNFGGFPNVPVPESAI